MILTVCPYIVEFRQIAPVQQQRIFCGATNPHICFQNLRAVVLAKYQRYVMLKPVLFSVLDDRLHLLKAAKYDHARRF